MKTKVKIYELTIKKIRMINYCIIVSSTSYLYVLEPFFRRKQVIIPALFNGDKVAVYIKRKSLFDLLILMMKDDIDNNDEILQAFNEKRIVDHAYKFRRK